MTIVVAAFYHFFDFPHFEQMRDSLLAEINRLDIKGSLLITSEGINSTISGSRESIDTFLNHLKTNIVKGDFEHKESYCDEQPFSRGKVRLKKETISIGEPTSLQHVGTYVDHHEWNQLLDDPETIVIDTRNNYEIHLGTFERAIDPGIRSFKHLPAYVREHLQEAKQKKIATFCTGGIRCEKFTSWLKGEGYEHVYHLKGGILQYLEDMPQEKSKWQGECYVFDERIAVDHQLEASKTASRCIACDHTLTHEDQQHPHYVPNQQCPHCHQEN